MPKNLYGRNWTKFARDKFRKILIRKEVIVAYIFNIPSTRFMPLPFLNGRHWFSSSSNNLDSKLAAPTLISTANGIVHYINTLLA
ncbi:hypothetical protein niasHS_009301 [Heterodera schachtii]|uniref:Uncharacterized protein n=1 Tax=Heterodera schachtii TaxID=97005 RepID=A0ABD2JBQ0_HETSC